MNFIQLRKKFINYSRPHLAALLRDNIPLATDWKLDKTPRPKPRKFNHNSMEAIEQRQARYATPRWKDTSDMRKPYRILCLDGGGVRGAITIELLRRIVAHDPNFLDQVDFICGTSAGGLVTLMLAAGYKPDEVSDLYKFASPHIFGYDPWRRINPFRSNYSDKAKEELMKEYFGNRTMVDLEKVCAVVAFRLDGRKSHTHSFFNTSGWRPAVFSNMPRAQGLVEPDFALHVWDAAMRTSAAPTYFPVYRGYVDGGIVANNPSMIAVTKAMAHHPNVNLRNCIVLSLGAGSYPRHDRIFSPAYNSNVELNTHDNVFNGTKSHELWRADWGLKQWAPLLVDLLLDGDSVTTDMLMHYLLDGGGLYHRHDPVMPRNIALDDWQSIGELTSFARNVDLTDTLNFVDKHFNVAYDEAEEDNMVTNGLDNSTNYQDAWQSYVLIHEELKRKEAFGATGQHPVERMDEARNETYINW